MTLEGDLDVTVDSGVEFTFTVTNTDSESRRLEFRSGKTVDFTVTSDDKEVWRWSDGRMFTQALQAETLEPGGSFVRTGTWSNPAPGTYVVVATLEASNAEVEARAEFEA